MTDKDKELLIKDLCCRLPYNVKVQSYNDEGIETIETLYNIDFDGYMSTTECDTLKNITKPYLFPLSSISNKIIDEIYNNVGVYDICIDSSVHIEIGTKFEDLLKISDILHKHHIDYRGLISMGLAIDATNLNIY